MNAVGIDTLVRRLRACTEWLFEGAAYIEREIADLDVSDDLRVEVERACLELLATEGDATLALDDLRYGADSTPMVISRVHGILDWLEQGNACLAELTWTLGQASEDDPSCMFVYCLSSGVAQRLRASIDTAKDTADALHEERDAWSVAMEALNQDLGAPVKLTPRGW